MSLKRDSLSNLIGNGTPLLVAVVAIPYLVRSLGDEKFGILTLMWALIGYFGLFDLGVGRALTYEVSIRATRQARQEIARSVNAGLIFTLCTGLAGVLLVLAITFLVHAGLFGTRKVLTPDTRTAFLIISLAIIPTTITSGLRGTMEGLKRFPSSNANRLIFGILMFLLPMAAIYNHDKSLTAIAGYLALGRLIVMLIAFWSVRDVLPEKLKIELQEIRLLLGYGVWVTISTIISPLMVYGDRFIVSAILGAQVLTYYAIPQEFLQRLLLFPTALTQALFPRLTQHPAGDSMRNLYRHFLMRVALVMGAVCLLVAFAAPPFFSIWISPAFADKARPIVWVLSAGVWFNSLGQLPYTMLHAMKLPKLTALFHIAELGLYGLVLIILCQHYGILGAAIAWSFRVTLDFFLLHGAVQKCCPSPSIG